MSIDAPIFSSFLTILVCPFSAAQTNGVSPFSSFASISAPRANPLHDTFDAALLRDELKTAEPKTVE
ncbi:uncharacterized protein PITG_04047 [Phytophthora infestans T30-4]|uniref:Secreted RxLR effector peptide protein n=1 Tax=Phytophthora infestans (strain T30-4) TaxID=403677 RepID=D0N0F0_PHYIT|nr:uncharacterized protein PITG_04047 [Phytophthora infestans T30-4]EEY67113.1 hypothetical protein PITG_04047 [Phytophthora infestans T30-4]|eukprot:XP_002905761.1 hypothetical protein PITG_04047 [Phytophthora infestans T30-4]